MQGGDFAAADDRSEAFARRVEARADCSADERARLGADLAALVKEGIGVSVSCDVVEPGTVERSQGKAVRVRDLRAQGQHQR